MINKKIELDITYTLNLSSLAVANIEEKYCKDFIDIVSEKLKAKVVNDIIFECILHKNDLTFEQFLVKFSERYTYIDAVNIVNELIEGDRKKTEEATENV